MALRTKRCKKCGEVKALALYHRSPTSADGRKAACARCYNAQSAEARDRCMGAKWDKINAELGSASISTRWGNRCLAKRRVAQALSPHSEE